MLMSSFAALAAEPEGYENYGAPYAGDTGYDTVWAGTADGSLAVKGLEPGDTVKFFQILAYDQNASAKWDELTDVTTGAGSWKVIAPFATGDNAITVADFKAILSTGIDDALAGKIAKNAVESTAEDGYKAKYSDRANDSGVATVGEAVPGLYVAIVTPAKAGWVYNPIFVASDYYKTGATTGTSNEWTIVADALSYSNRAMAKKSTITLDKKATDRQSNDLDFEGTVRVGDIVDFTVETTIPEFADNYTSAKFFLTDVLSDGLTLDQTSVKVYPGWVSDSTCSDTELSKNYTEGETQKTDGYAVTDTSATGYKVDFKSAYLLSLAGAQKITVKYNAKVTTKAPFSVNLETNTVTLNYSNHPEDGEGHGRLKDETKHYTFDIDADILGQDAGSWKTTEVVKVGLDKDGKEIYQSTTTLHENQGTYNPLANAKFKLYVADTNGSLTKKDYQDHDVKLSQYTNDLLPADKFILSDSTGRLNIEGTTNGIRGLDAGVYYLVEEEAPAGYIKYQKAVKIEIICPKPEGTATSNDYWELKEYTDATDTSIKWSVWELKKYEVKMDDVETAHYTFQNKTQAATNYGDRKPGEVVSTKTDTITASEANKLIGSEGATVKAYTGKIPNTQGVELPSTGGMGTTILYVGGSILVILAAILLITKRRMNAED